MRDDELLLVDSQELALFDLASVDNLVERTRPYFTGTRFLDDGYLLFDRGAVCSTWMDGQYAYLAHIKNGAVQAFGIDFTDEDEEFENASWFTAGTFFAPTGVLAIGDPGQLEDYVPDPFEAPFQSFEVWALATLPGPGSITMHLRRRSPEPDTLILGMRWEWAPTPDVGAPADTPVARP